MSQPHVMERCRAVTLIEAVLFVSVALAVIVGGLVFYQQASTSSTMQRTVSLISALSAEMNLLHETATIPDSGLEVSAILAASGAIPSGYLNATGDGAVSPWGGQMKMTMLGRAAEDDFVQYGNQVHMYQFFDMPPRICARLAHFDAAGKGVLGFTMMAIGINTANLADPNPPDGRGFRLFEGPLSRSDGAAACTAGSGPVWMHMAFAYR
jgi:hypothetical protein